MKNYHDMVSDILANGHLTSNRTDTKTLTVFGRQYVYPMKDGFPILTTRYQDFRKIAIELFWYFTGSSECTYLDQHDVKIWKAWTDPHTNSVGPLYPVQLRNYKSFRNTPHPKYLVKSEEKTMIAGSMWYEANIDQLELVINGIKFDPFSRRHVISFWNPTYLPDTNYTPIENVEQGNMALAPCPTLMQFSVRELSTLEALSMPENRATLAALCHDLSKEGLIVHDDPDCCETEEKEECIRIVTEYVRSNPTKDYSNYPLKKTGLSLMLYQRSLDVGAAGGWNVSMYSLLLHMVAKLTGHIPFEFIHAIGDMHIYEDQISVLTKQISRDPYPLPKLVIHGEHESIDDFDLDDIELTGYQHHDKLVIPVST